MSVPSAWTYLMQASGLLAGRHHLGRQADRNFPFFSLASSLVVDSGMIPADRCKRATL
jgi:hypothetical protein